MPTGPGIDTKSRCAPEMRPTTDLMIIKTDPSAMSATGSLGSDFMPNTGLLLRLGADGESANGVRVAAGFAFIKRGGLKDQVRRAYAC